MIHLSSKTGSGAYREVITTKSEVIIPEGLITITVMPTGTMTIMYKLVNGGSIHEWPHGPITDDKTSVINGGVNEIWAVGAGTFEIRVD